MTNYWILLRAEIKRYFAISWSVPGDNLSWFIYTILVFAAAIMILSGVSGGGLTSENQLLVMVGWMTWIVASDCMAELPNAVVEESQTGTLEQICTVPVKLTVILAVRSLAFLFGAGIRGILATIILGLFIARFQVTFGLVILFLVSLLGAYGMGFIFAGLALVLKRVQALTSLVFSLMIFLTGALVGLERLGVWYQVLKLAFPLTWGISLMRSLVQGVNVAELWGNGELIGVVVHSLLYLALGLGIFAWGYHRARAKGTLGQY